MVAVTLGMNPQDLVVELAAGGDFVAALAATPPWPTGTVLQLRFSSVPVETNPIIWPATVAGAVASWSVPAAAVQSVLDVDARYARLHYTASDGSTLIWMSGVIHVS